MDTMSSLLAIVCLILVPSLVKASRDVNSLYFTNLNDIQLLNNNLTTVVLGGLELAESLDCNICDQKIYWVDQAGKIKRGTPNNQSSIEVIISHDLRHPIGIAVDWKGNNIYFSDTRNADRLGRVEVASCDGKRRKVLFHDLIRPGPLALNVLTGHLYYIDYYDIKRAQMDGQHSERVYSDFSAFDSAIKGLAVDIFNNLLFWTVGSEIKYINLTDWEVLGPDFVRPVTVIRQTGMDPHGIAVVNSIIYWTEQRLVNQQTHQIDRPGAIYSLDTATNINQTLLRNASLSPQDLSTFTNVSVRQDGCAVNNGNCEHFCFTVPNGNGGTRAQCGCTTGIRLHSDNGTCPDFPSQFLLFTQTFENHTDIRQISLDFPDTYIDIQVPIYGLSNDVSFLSYDLVLHQIYWAEIDPPSIRRAYANGSCVETFIGTGLRHPEGLAVDSYSRNLYWVDSALNRIEVARLSDRTYRRVLFSSDLDHPQGLALDLAQEFMYWTDLDTSEPKVERARMDGTGRADLPGRSRTIKIPTNVAVDPLTGWVYWSDTDNSIDEISRYDGTLQTETVLTLTGLEDVFGLAIHGDYIYWTDRLATSRALVRARKSSGDNEQVILSQHTGLRGLIAVNSTAENVRTSCSISYGDCRELCLPSGTMASCACRDNFILTDNNQCEDSDPYAFVSSNTKLALYDITQSNSLETWRRPVDEPLFNTSALAISIDYRDSMLYWIQSDDKLIYRQYVNLTSFSEPQPVVSCCLVTPEDLAVDWLGRNLYWTDSTRRVIEVAKLNGKGRSILAHIPDSLGAPSFIALDPTRGHLYWVPKSENKIYKMLMNGSSQSEVFWRSTEPTGEIIGLAVNYEDTPNDVIYWGIRTPETTVRDILMKQELNNPQSGGMEVTRLRGMLLLHIATFRKSIYYHNQHAIFGDVIHNYNTVQQSDNQVLTVGSRGNIEDFTDFVIVHHSLQPGIHECSVMTRGCGGDATLCLISNSVDGVCRCPAWMAKRTDQDGAGMNRETCINPSSLLLIATQEAIHYLPVLPDSLHLTSSRPQPLPIGPLYNVSAVAYDPVNESVLWVDKDTQFLHSATVDGRQFRNVTEIENVSVFSMTYDWIGGHIFITEDRGFQIELLTINGEEVGSFLLHDVQQTRNLPRPGDVIFDMNESTLYWTTLSRSGLGRSIQYMSLNSPNVVRTLNVSGKTSDLMIDKLTFEPSTRSLYWINRSNTTNSTIERFDILSGNLTIIATDATSVSVLAAMTVSDRPYVFWYNMRDRAIYRYDGQHRNYSLYQYWTAPGPIVGFVGSERQPRITVPHPCLSSPRPCSHLCIQQQRTPGYHCGCPSNRNLEPDDTTCSELRCEGVQSPCNDGFGCYPTAYYCDGVNHCRNGYDETECSCDTTYQRGCPNSSVCLTNTSWCNGSEECPNGEDEAPESCCPSNLFGCYSSGSLQCLQLDLLCDGMQDCDNREDEDNENCTNPSHTSSTPMTSPPPSTGHPNTSIQLPIIITVSFIALLIVLVVICILCMAVLRCVHKRSAKFCPTRGAMIYKPSSSPSENGSLYYSETSGGTHLTHLDPYGNNLSPSSTDSTFKRVSVLSTDPSNPPPTPNTERRSAFVTTEIGIDGMSTLSQPFSECDSHVPPNPPAPSLNFDEMSSMSCSVSQRNVQVAMNGIDPHTHVHRHNRYGHGRNPLLAHNNHHYQQERYYHPSYYYHQHNPYSHHFANHRPPHLHHAHFVRAHGERFDAQSDSESTLSMTTVNTDNQDDLPPPGRPPSPATMTEYSETHIHPLPSTSPISEDSEECSENFLHQE